MDIYCWPMIHCWCQHNLFFLQCYLHHKESLQQKCVSIWLVANLGGNNWFCWLDYTTLLLILYQMILALLWNKGSLGKLAKKNNRGFSEFGTISLRTPPPYTNSEKHNSENWSIFLIPSLPIEIVNKTLNYVIEFVTFESTEWKLNPNKASNVYIKSDWIVFHDNF